MTKNWKEIPLTQGYFTKVDNEDYLRFGHKKWHVSKTKSGLYVYCSNGKNKENVGNQKSLSRLIMNAPRGMCVDHINHDTLDNRKCNLRVCTTSQNNANRVVVRNLCGFKGVSEKKYMGKKVYTYYAAGIKQKNVFTYIGTYKTAVEAAMAYDKKVVEMFGEFAVTNEKLGLLRHQILDTMGVEK